MPVSITLYSDPACPWAYSVWPSLHVLRWRYGDQLDWRFVAIGLRDTIENYNVAPAAASRNQMSFRRFGMPFLLQPKERPAPTGVACRAIVAARLRHPGSELEVYRQLALAQFTSTFVLDDREAMVDVIDRAGVSGGEIVAALDDPDVLAAYEQDKVEARQAHGTAAEKQGKAREQGDLVRYTAPSLVFEANGTRLVAGGWQTIEAYDVCVTNVDPMLERQPPPDDPEPLLAAFPDGLTTQEVTALLVSGNDDPNRVAAEQQLFALVADGKATRTPLGNDALWRPA
jgi:2-hydroxychromene-2-carboxylate isomerase